MKVLVIYSSKTGFTKRYAERIADDTNAMLLPVKEAKSKSDDFFNEYDAIIYGGWIMAGRVDGADWFLKKLRSLIIKSLYYSHVAQLRQNIRTYRKKQMRSLQMTLRI